VNPIRLSFADPISGSHQGQRIATRVIDDAIQAHGGMA
jgi:hypothetical protein